MRYKCANCGKWFEDTFSLKNSWLINEYNNKIYCDKCLNKLWITGRLNFNGK